MAAMSIPGVILSQLEMQTSASTLWALAMYSTLSAMSSREGSEYSMPSCPIAMPSSIAIVSNSAAKQPRGLDRGLHPLADVVQVHVAGTSCVKELTTAIDRPADRARRACRSPARGCGRRPCAGPRG